MEQLETTQLPPVIHHDWAKHLHESLPTTRTRVLDDVNAQFNNWLFQLRDLHRRVGKLAMDATVLRQRSKFENLKRGPSVSTEIARAAQHMGAVNPARTPQQMNQLIKKSLSVELALNEENECWYEQGNLHDLKITLPLLALFTLLLSWLPLLTLFGSLASLISLAALAHSQRG